MYYSAMIETVQTLLMNLRGQDWKQMRMEGIPGKRKDMNKGIMGTMERQGESQTTEALEYHTKKQGNAL